MIPEKKFGKEAVVRTKWWNRKIPKQPLLFERESDLGTNLQNLDKGKAGSLLSG